MKTRRILVSPARLPDQQRKALEAQQKLLTDKIVQLDTRHKDKSEELASQRALNLTDCSSDALKQNIDACETQLKQVRQEIGADAKGKTP